MKTLFLILMPILLGLPPQAKAFVEESLIIALSEDEKAVLLSGPIDELPGTSLARILRELPASVELIQLESGGGRLDVALEAAREIKKRGLRTYTNIQCNSACTFLFLAGSERSANRFTRFEFHQIRYFVNGKPENGPLQAYWQGRASQYYLDFGLPEDFVYEVESKASTTRKLGDLMNMGFVTRDESVDLRFKNGRTIYSR